MKRLWLKFLVRAFGVKVAELTFPSGKKRVFCPKWLPENYHNMGIIKYKDEYLHLGYNHRWYETDHYYEGTWRMWDGKPPIPPLELNTVAKRSALSQRLSDTSPVPPVEAGTIKQSIRMALLGASAATMLVGGLLVMVYGIVLILK